MPGSLRPSRVLVPAVAVCLLFAGGGLAARAAHQPARAATTGGTSGASPHASLSTSPTDLPSAEMSTSPSPSPSTSPSPSPSTSDPGSLDAASTARAVELARLAEEAQALSKKLRERPVAEFTMANFNVQGATHRGNIQARTRMMRDLLLSHGADVVSLQEFQRPQRAIFARIASATYDVYPGTIGPSLDAENSIAWRRDRFELVRGETRPYPYFLGAIRHLPRVLLRDRKTGVELFVTSYHNPATCCGYGNAAGYRARAINLQISDANALITETGTPLIVAGDMNDRATYFCAMTGGVAMHSADGGTNVGGCQPPPHAWIDWILGTKQVKFSGYLRDRSAVVRRTSDHPIVVVTARVKGKPGAGQNADPPTTGN